MTRSTSTPRLRLTAAWYCALLVFAGLNAPTSLLDGADTLRRITALLLVVGAVLGRIWCSVFIAGLKDQHLVTVGPYSVCRHPLYALSMMAGLGLGLASRSLLVTAATLVLLMLLFGRAVRAEETLLAGLHSEAYRTYRERTPRFWPRWANYVVPESIAIAPRVFWKSFLDAGSIVVLLALVEIAIDLHDRGLLPSWWSVP